MRYFSTFSGIGGLFTKLSSGILVIWIERNIRENIKENGKPKTENTSWRWREQDTTLKHQGKKLRKSERIKIIVKGLELRHYSTMAANVLVVVRKQLSSSALTISITMVQNTGKRWQTNQ